jgi:2-dehydro-3-deoxyphosphooctonate aldolase (KDO 8-P synthase)
MERGLQMLGDVKSKYGLRILTDIHEAWQAQPVGEVCDVLQIPAFLCRQTDLLVAAAKTGKTINIKKGQFLSGEAMGFAVEKIRQSGNDKVMLTERGSMFGYQDLVVDYRNIAAMQKFNVPVILDVTHSLQQPNQSSGVTGGQPELISLIAKAGIAAGADGIFMEVHPEPKKAKSDGANMLRLDLAESLLRQLVRIKEAVTAS